MNEKIFKHKTNTPIELLKAAQRMDITRREILIGGASLIASAGLLGCQNTATNRYEQSNQNIGIDKQVISPALSQKPSRDFAIEARPAMIEIALGRRVEAWTYGGLLPGSEIRVREGERLRIAVRNGLPLDTSVHWHGIPQRGTNNMDGVPGVTQDSVKPGDTFIYDFLAESAGTYMFHSHSGLQIERGLYAPLIIEAKNESLQYDREYILMLDDWLGSSPEVAFAKLRRGEMQGSHSMPNMASSKTDKVKEIKTEGTSDGGKETAMQMEEGSDVNYASFLINGRTPESALEFKVKRSERIRFRLINASSSTMYRFAIGGHKLTVTHTDGMEVKPIEVDTLEISMGERYDILITANNSGLWPIVAISTDETERGARAILRYEDASASSLPPINAKVAELGGRLLNYNQLTSVGGSPISAKPDRQIEVLLSGQMMPYEWKINGKLYPDAEPFEVHVGERVRVRMVNNSLMRHPMHLHGHSFHLLMNNAQTPFKDTVFIEPHGGTLEFEFVANNPGNWLFHCHHAYHMEAGMARIFKYV